MKLALIGEGYVKSPDNFHINEELVRLVGKKSPHVLFIPTASRDEGPIVVMIESVQK